MPECALCTEELLESAVSNAVNIQTSQVEVLIDGTAALN